MPFSIKELNIPDVLLINAEVHGDERGHFSEIYKNSEFSLKGLKKEFPQDNLVFSGKNVLRGLHYQLQPSVQGKLVTVIKGEIFDVALDIRYNSPSYGKWVWQILDDVERKMMYIPEGFAHGYCVLSNESIIAYKTTAEYSPHLDCGIKWNDSYLNIEWPVQHPILSEKDQNLSDFRRSNRNLHELRV